ncbi:MAG: ABC transporter permease, partial [Ramlibacter sp.]
MSAIPVIAPAPLNAPGFWKRAARHRSFVLGAVLTLLLVFTALLSFVWTPFSPYEVDMAAKMLPPDAHH